MNTLLLKDAKQPKEPWRGFDISSTQAVRYAIGTSNAAFGTLAPIMNAASLDPWVSFSAQTAQSVFSVLNAGVKTYDLQMGNIKEEERIHARRQNTAYPYVALPKEGYGWKAYGFNLAAHTALYTGLMYYRYHALEHAEDGKPDPATALNLAIASGAVTVGS